MTAQRCETFTGDMGNLPLSGAIFGGRFSILGPVDLNHGVSKGFAGPLL